MSGLHNILRTTSRRSPAVVLLGAALSDGQEAPSIATVNYRLLATGEEQTFEGSGWVTIGTWLQRGAAADYEFRYDGTGDPPSPNGFNEWVGCDTSPENLLEQSGVGTQSNSGTVEVRSKASKLVLASASLSQSVLVIPSEP